MKELFAIHDKILAQGIEVDPDERINFSRDEIGDEDDLLTTDLRADLTAVQQRINASLPDDFDYFAFVGSEERPTFNLLLVDHPAAFIKLPEFEGERSLIPQLESLEWDALRAEGLESQKRLDAMMRVVDVCTATPRSSKQVQKEFREESKDFVKEKRRDAGQIHVLWWDRLEGLMEIEYPNGEELRKVLPGLLYEGGEVITIVAFGKPLAADRLDALLGEARAKFDAIVDAFVAEDDDAGAPLESPLLPAAEIIDNAPAAGETPA